MSEDKRPPANDVEELFERWVEQQELDGKPADAEEISRDRPDLLAPLQELIRKYEYLGRLIDPRPDLQPGRTLLHYRIIEKLGAGGMGEVYLADDLKLGRRVALKVLPPETASDADRLERFRREARIVASLNHPNIVTLHSVEEAEGIRFLTMELVKGKTLGALIHPGGLKADRILEIVTPLADALAAAHEQGIIHRDLKPSNIMVGAESRPKILDFGLAKLEPPGATLETRASTRTLLTQTGQIMGTVAYMSPEQARGEPLDVRTDIFSLGVILYELATGARPFAGNNPAEALAELLEREPRAPRDLAPELPRQLEWIILKCLEKDRERRYPSARDLAGDLERLRSSSATAFDRPRRAARRPILVAAGTALLAAILLAGNVGGLRDALLGEVSTDEPAPAQGTETTPRPPVVNASGRPSVMVMSFEDHSGSEDLHWLSDGLPEMLLTGLAQTPGLDVVSSQRLHEILGQVGAPNLANVDKRRVAEIARRAGAGAVVAGSIFQAGSETRIDFRLEDVEGGRVLAARSVKGTNIFSLVDELTASIRVSLELGDGAAGRSVAEVTTSSADAYRAYTEALVANRNLRFEDARRLLEEAVRLDPSFAMAYMELADWSEGALAHRYEQKVLENLDRLPERRRVLFQLRFFEESSQGWRKAVERLEAFRDRYPDEVDAYRLLAKFHHRLQQPERALAALERGVENLPASGPLRMIYGYNLMMVGHDDEALRQFEAYVLLDPKEANAHDSLGEILVVTGQPERALEKFTRAYELNPSFLFEYCRRAWALGMLGRFDEALVELQTLQEQPGRRQSRWRLEGPFLQAFLLSRIGRYREADSVVEAEVQENRGQGRKSAELELLRALLALDMGDYSSALESVLEAEKLFPLDTEAFPAEKIADYWPAEVQEQDLQAVAHLLGGVAEARSGHPGGARDRLVALAGIYDANNPRRKWWFNALEGEIALAAGELAAAESAFARGEPPERMWFNLIFVVPDVFGGNLPLRDGRARVLSARGDLLGAIEIYRELLSFEHPKWVSVLEPRYVLELARLLNRTGDAEGARREYRRFLELWKDADPGLPEVIEAKLAREPAGVLRPSRGEGASPENPP